MYRLALVLLLALSPAFGQNIASVAATPSAPEATVKAVADHAFNFKAAGNAIQLWVARSVTGKANAAEGALYPDVPIGAFCGVIEFKSEAQDFRGQKIVAGTYTLRYAQIPADGNHLGVAPSPDFLLLVPVANDPDPSVLLPYPRLVKLSPRAAGTAHPAAFAMTAAGMTAVATDEKGHVAVTFELNVNGKKLQVALIVAGTAEQ